MFDKILKSDPTYIKAWEVLGLSYIEMNQYEDAINAFERAIKLDPKSEKYWCYKATAFQKMEKKEQAIQCADTALTLNPSSQVARMIKESVTGVPLESSTVGKMIGQTVGDLVKGVMDKPDIKKTMNELVQKYKNLSPFIQQLLELIVSLNDPYQAGRLMDMYFITLKSRDVSQQVRFFEELIKYIMGEFHERRKVMALVYHGEDAIQKVRAICGATNPEEADPRSIRGAYGRITTSGIYENAIHASANPEEAEREVRLWFSPEELVYHIYAVNEAEAKPEKKLFWA